MPQPVISRRSAGESSAWRTAARTVAAPSRAPALACGSRRMHAQLGQEGEGVEGEAGRRAADQQQARRRSPGRRRARG